MKKRRGFNLTELVIVIVLISLISTGVFALVKTPAEAGNLSKKEFDLQSGLRISSEIITDKIRNSTATYIISKNDKDFTDKWNYLLCEKDNVNRLNKIVVYEWNGSKHEENVLAEFPSDNYDISITFDKNDAGNILKYSISAKDLSDNKEKSIDAEIKILNSNNIFTDSNSDVFITELNKTKNCLAYRTDKPILDNAPKGSEDEGTGGSTLPSNNVKYKGTMFDGIFIALVIDASTSLNSSINEKTHNGPKPIDDNVKKRHFFRKEILNSLKAIKENDKANLVNVKFYPFSGGAFSQNESFKPGGIHNRLVNIGTEDFSSLQSMVDDSLRINDMMSAGSRNTGDGLRMAYYDIVKHKKANPNLSMKYYVYLISTGHPTASTRILLKEQEYSKSSKKYRDKYGLDEVFYTFDDKMIGFATAPTFLDGTPITTIVDRKQIKNTNNMFFELPGYLGDWDSNGNYIRNKIHIYRNLLPSESVGNPLQNKKYKHKIYIHNLMGGYKDTKNKKQEMDYAMRFGEMFRDLELNSESRLGAYITLLSSGNYLYCNDEYNKDVANSFGRTRLMHHKRCKTEKEFHDSFEKFTNNVIQSSEWTEEKPN